MLITISQVKEEWKSPDGQLSIWGLVNQMDGTPWKTMSKKIADSEGQTMELTTRVSKNGKTYLIQPPREDSPYGNPGGQGNQAAKPAGPASANLDRLEVLVDRLEAAVDGIQASRLPKPDVIPTETISEAEMQKRLDDVFGPDGIEDDLR